MGALGGAATLELYVPTMSDPDLHPRRFRSLHLVGSIGKFVEENFSPQRSGGGFRLVTVGGSWLWRRNVNGLKADTNGTEMPHCISCACNVRTKPWVGFRSKQPATACPAQILRSGPGGRLTCLCGTAISRARVQHGWQHRLVCTGSSDVAFRQNTTQLCPSNPAGGTWNMDQYHLAMHSGRPQWLHTCVAGHSDAVMM